jgi:hypothetical protein
MARTGLSAGASTALSTTYARMACTATPAADPLSEALPDRVTLSWASLELTTISGAASVIWYLSADADGDAPITPTLTTTIVADGATATSGGVAATLALARVGSGGSIYVNAKTDAGTATGIARVSWTL